MITKKHNKLINNETVSMGNALTNALGFSLIEIMIAIVIFSIGVLGIASMQTNALSGNNHAKKMSGSTEKALALLEELTKLPYNHTSLIAGTTTPATNSDGIDNNNDGIVDEAGETGNYTVAWTVLDDALIAETKTIAVTVTSAVPNKQVTLASVVPLIR